MKKIITAILSIIGALSLTGAIFIGILYFSSEPVSNNISETADFTGQDLFNAVNQYRVSQNLTELEVDIDLCNNLVERWLAVSDPTNGHQGFTEWAEEVRSLNENKFADIGELYIINANTPQEAIDFWISSPGHKLGLEDPNHDVMCSYALNGVGVVELGKLSE